VKYNELRRRLDTPAGKADVRAWEELPSLTDLFWDGNLVAGVKYTDADIDDDVMEVAKRYLFDIRRMRLVDIQSEFMREMIRQFELAKYLSVPQARGVINVLGGGLKWSRARFKRSRVTRRDRHEGLENCLVCGGPLDDEESVARAIGYQCYRRVMGDRG
jgi:hypothetical protein